MQINHQQKIVVGLGFGVFFLGMLGQAFAKNPFGIGIAEQAINPASPFAIILLKIQNWQMQFERVLQSLLVEMRTTPEGLGGLTLSLIGLAFVYGILHAAGPGHGKAVISSYLIADHASLRRGIILSFLSSLLQAGSAIAIIMLIFFFLPGRLTQTTYFVVLASFALMMFVGLRLLIRRTKDLLSRRSTHPIDTLFDKPINLEGQSKAVSHTKVGERISASSSFVAMPVMKAHFTNVPSCASVFYTSSPQLVKRHQEGKNFMKNFRQICAECGQIHLVNPNHLQEKLSLKTALSLMCATGLRPCNGALFVMSFAMFNQLEWIGILAVLAMSFGTFITVSSLACLAVYAKAFALAIGAAKSHRSGGKNIEWIKTGVEWCAALFIFITGMLLLLSNFM